MLRRRRVCLLVVSVAFVFLFFSVASNVIPVTNLDGISHQSTMMISEPMSGNTIVAGTPHDPIIIDGDEAFAATALAEGWDGDGSPDNPFIIENFDIIRGSDAVPCISISNTRVCFVVRNCLLTGEWVPNSFGVLLHNVMNAVIFKNTISYNERGIRMKGNSENNVLANNTGSENLVSIQLSWSTHNLIANNTFFRSGAVGIQLDSGAHNNTVVNNTIDWTGGYGICLDGVTDCLIANNTCSTSHTSGIEMDYANSNTVVGNVIDVGYLYGIYMHRSNDNLISENTGVTCADAGVWLNGQNNLVKGNSFTQGGSGIYLDRGSNTVTDNTCNNNDFGIYGDGPGLWTVVNNTCNANSWDGIFLYSVDSNNVVNNTCNNNQMNGIHIRLCNSNTFTNNSCNSNGDYGIYIDTSFSQPSDSNEILWNVYEDNSLGNGADHGTNNVFDYNYWSDYTGIDADGDGIGDTPYSLVTNTDSHPRMSPCVAVDDAYTTNVDAVLVVAAPGVLGNDYDHADDSLVAYVVTETLYGSLTLYLDGGLEYHPDTDWSGTDSFTYQAFDGSFYTVAATVTIEVLPNHAPVALDDTYTTDEDVPLVVAAAGVLLNDGDVDEDALTAVLENDVLSGTLAINADGSFTYTPNPDFCGTDTFTYHASDGLLDSNTVTVSITVNSVNDPPIVTNPGLQFSIEGHSDSLQIVATDPENDILSYSASGLPVGLVINPSTGLIHGTLGFDAAGVYPVTVSVTDGQSSTDVTFDWMVQQVGDVNSDGFIDIKDALLIAQYYVGLNPSNFKADVADVNFDGTIDIVDALLVAQEYTFSLPDTGTPDGAEWNGEVGELWFSPITEQGVGDFFETEVYVNTGTEVLGAYGFSIMFDPNVVHIEGVVEGSDGFLSVYEIDNTNGKLEISGFDVSGMGPGSQLHILTIQWRAVSIGNSLLDLTVYHLADGSPRTIGTPQGIDENVVVASPNTPPVALDDTATTDEDVPITIDVLANDYDADGDTLVIDSVGLASHGTAAIITGMITYTPDANYNGPDSFTYTVSDGNGGTDTATVTITVNPVNDAPVAADDAYTMDEDTVLVVPSSLWPGLLMNDGDVDGNFLVVVVVAEPEHGSLVLTSGAGIGGDWMSGGFTYTPEQDFSGTVAFTYQAFDGVEYSNIATVTIEVLPVNDAPVADAGGPYITDEGLQIAFDASGSTDIEGDPLQFHWDFGDGSTGTGKTPTHTYADNGVYIVTLTVTDNDGGVDTDTQTVTVNNVAPMLLFSGPASVDEGSVYTLTLFSSDPGLDTITQWTIDWGDGPIEIVAGDPTSVTHTYVDGLNSYLISATATDEDGTHDANFASGGTFEFENLGFETGNFAGWSVNIPMFSLGSAHVVTSYHTGDPNYNWYYPMEGSYFARLKTGISGAYPTLQKTLSISAGQTITGWAAFHAPAEYSIFYSAGAMVLILDSSGVVIKTPWSADVSTVGSYGDSGWMQWEWTASSDGTYVIEYRVSSSSSSINCYALFDAVFLLNNVAPTTLTVTVNNVVPTLLLSGLHSVDEGSVYTLYLSSNDPGLDTITHWTIDWGDVPVEVVAGDPSSVTHTYVDGPNSYMISATATDEDGTHDANFASGGNLGSENFGFETGNFAGWSVNIPMFSLGSAHVVTSYHTGDPNYNWYYPMEGSYFARLKSGISGAYPTLQKTLSISAGQTITGWAAFHTLATDFFSSGNAMVLILDSSGVVIKTPWSADVNMVGYRGDSGWMQWEWTASSDGTYVIEYRVAKGGLYSSDSYALFDAVSFVNNVAPVADAGPDQTVDEGDTVSFIGGFDDPGLLDTHTYEWDFGDGSTGTEKTPTHIYVDGGIYTVKLTVTDNDGGVGTDTLMVTVLDITPPVTTVSLDRPPEYAGWYQADVIVTLESIDTGSGVATTTYRYEGISWTEYTGPFTFSLEGVTTLEFNSTDLAGNVEPTNTLEIMIDTMTPVPDISLDGILGENGWYISDVTVIHSIADGMSGVGWCYFMFYDAQGPEFILEEIYYNGLASAEFTLTASMESGEIWAWMNVSDVAGNWITDELVFKIDKTPPETSASLDRPPDSNGWYRWDVTVTLTAIDGDSGVAATEYSYDEVTWIPYAGSFNIIPTGEITIYYRSSDDSGNMELTKSIPVKIDKSAPETTINLEGTLGLNDWYTSDVIGTFSAVDDSSGVRQILYSFDGITWYTYYSGLCTTTLTATAAPSSIYPNNIFSVYGDLTNEMQEPIGSETINLYFQHTADGPWSDWIYLGTCTTNEDGHYIYSVVADWGLSDYYYAVRLRADFAGTPIYSSSFAMDYVEIDYFEEGPIEIIIGGIENIGTICTEGPIGTEEPPILQPLPDPITISDEGTYIIYYYSIDMAGNMEEVQSAIVQIDKTPPVTSIAFYRPPDFNDWYTHSVELTLTVEDEHSQVASTFYRCGDEDWTLYTGPFTFSIEGETTIYFYSIDNAGHVESIKSQVVKLDDDITPPMITIVYTGDGTDANPGVWTVTVIDPESGIDSIIVEINGVEVGTSEGEYPVPNELGTYTINVTAINADLDWGSLDQESSTKQGTVTITDDDTTPPEITIVGPEPMVPFEEVYGNWLYPVSQTFTIPEMDITSCRMEITAHCSADDWASIRAIQFRLDGIGGWIGTYYLGPGQVRGNVISPGQTLTFIYDMSHVKFADSSSPGYYFVNFIPLSPSDTTGFLSPGVHTIEAWVSSQEDGAPGSWVTIKLYFNGIATYENPGYWTVSADDPESGVDSFVVEIDGEIAGFSAGDYPVPSTVGTHTISVIAYNADLDRGFIDQEWSTSSATATVTDVIAPTTTLLQGSPFVEPYLTSATSLELISDDGPGIGVDYTCYRINDGPWFIYEVPFVLTGEDGDYTVYYYAVDFYGNTEVEKSMIFTLDNSPPVTTLHVGTPVVDDYVTSNTPLDLTADDDAGVDVASIHYKVNDGPWQIYGDSFFLTGDDGEYTIHYYAVDYLGNIETELSTVIILDNSAPTTTMNVDTPEHNSYVTSNTHLGLDAIDTGSEVYATYYRINYGEWNVYSSEFTLTGPDGVYWVEYFSNDTLGNIETTHSVSYQLDNSMPVSGINLSGDLGDNNWYISSVFITITFSDGVGSGVASVYYILDSGDATLYTGTFEESGNKDDHIIEYWSIDNLGKIESPHNTYTFKIDTEDPVTTPSVHPVIPDGTNDWYVSPVGFTLSPIDATSGVYEAYYRVNGGPDLLYTGAILFSSDGKYTVKYWSIDNAGNTESEQSIYFQIDQTAPETTHEILPPFSESGDTFTYISTTTDIVLNPTDNLADVYETKYRVDSGAWIIYIEPFNVQEIGAHTVFYKSTDMAGNVESEHSFDVVVNASELSYIGELSGIYSDPASLEARLIDVATQLPIAGKTIHFKVGGQQVDAATNSTGYASVTIVLSQPSGTYLINASFNDDGEYLASFKIHDFIIEKETAYVEYTGSTVVPTTVGTITLRATVFDDDDGYWGQLTKVNVTFRIYTVSIDALILYQSHGEYQVEATLVEGVGVFKIDILNLPANSYIVIISLDPDVNDYYQGDDSEDAVITVYEPTGDFVTGGGWIWDSEGHKGNFGFNVKYKKNGFPKGQFIYVYRTSEYKFIVKATAWLGMAIIDNHSFFEAKCVVLQFDIETGELIWSEGNYKLRVDVWDNAEKEGVDDVFQIRVYDKIGLLWYEAGFDPFGFLQGGNIVIHIDKEK